MMSERAFFANTSSSILAILQYCCGFFLVLTKNASFYKYQSVCRTTSVGHCKAENAPNERQSRALRGVAKLDAKIMKTRESMITSDHSPYAGGELAWSMMGLQKVG